MKKHKMKTGIPYLPPDDYDKAIGQLRLQLNGVFDNFHQYGQDVYIPGAIDKCIKLAEDFSLRTRGLDHPIQLKER